METNELTTVELQLSNVEQQLATLIRMANESVVTPDTGEAVGTYRMRVAKLDEINRKLDRVISFIEAVEKSAESMKSHPLLGRFAGGLF